MSGYHVARRNPPKRLDLVESAGYPAPQISVRDCGGDVQARCVSGADPQRAATVICTGQVRRKLMHEMRLFYTPLWRASMADTEQRWILMRQAMLDRIQQLTHSERGVAKTNFGGWQSADDLYKQPEFAWLFERILERANEVAPHFSREGRFNDGLLWANVNGQYNFNAMHIHADALLSGVIYLKVAGEDQGVIQFFDAREGSPTSYWRCFSQLPDETEMTQGVVTVAPREGDILLFPGWLKHWVTPNLTDQVRVSVSFNLRMS